MIIQTKVGGTGQGNLAAEVVIRGRQQGHLRDKVPALRVPVSLVDIRITIRIIIVILHPAGAHITRESEAVEINGRGSLRQPEQQYRQQECYELWTRK